MLRNHSQTQSKTGPKAKIGKTTPDSGSVRVRSLLREPGLLSPDKLASPACQQIFAIARILNTTEDSRSLTDPPDLSDGTMRHSRFAGIAPPRKLALLLAVTLAAAVGCGRKSTDLSATSGANDAGDTRSSRPAAKKFDHVHPVVRIETNLGPITIKLDAASAPGTVRNFLNYINEGFYDNTLIHYVDAGKMILAGGYTAQRAPKPVRPAIRNEAHNGLKNKAGTVAMARDQSLIDSATSQFFINLADAPQRDYQGDAASEYGYCVFGEVIEGLDVAGRISRSTTTNLGNDLLQTPDPPVVISSIRVIR
jgi:peptidyl-prolyl cis-trans isomerase B (cyclophilin B)